MPKKWMAFVAILLLSLLAVVPALAQGDTEDPPQLQTDASEPSAEGSGETMVKNGFYCRTPEAVHPVVEAIAMRYGVDYTEVLGLFCGTAAPEGEQQEGTPHYGLGVIMLAYKTSIELNHELSATELLACKSQLGGWGQVWKSLGFKGRSGNGSGVSDGTCVSSTPETDLQSDRAASDHPGNAGGNGNGNGKGKGKANKPAHAGPNK